MMQCPKCGYENRPDARFCGRCGYPISAAPLCPQCGKEVRQGAHFCPHCGRQLPDASEAGVRAGSTPPVEAPPVSSHRPVPSYTPTPAYTEPPYPQADGAPRYDANVQALQRQPVWSLGLISFVLSGLIFLCIVIALAAAPAFSEDVPPLPEEDPGRQDITILVREAYINDMLGEALPEGVDGEAVLDVRPGNELVTTVDFKLLIVRFTVVIHAGIAVEDNQVAVWVESVEAGGRNVLDLVGVDQVTLGENITGKVQEGLEEELGEGARLLTIVTDETHVILTARWE